MPVSSFSEHPTAIGITNKEAIKVRIWSPVSISVFQTVTIVQSVRGENTDTSSCT